MILENVGSNRNGKPGKTPDTILEETDEDDTVFKDSIKKVINKPIKSFI